MRVIADQAGRKKAYERSALEAFDRDAAAGERLDPDNAFFPLMRSVGLFAEHRDDEALAAIQRAGAKPRFQEYALGSAAHSHWNASRQSHFRSQCRS